MPPAPGAGGGGGGGGGQDEGSTAIIWGIAAIFVILGVIWYVFKIQIISGYLRLKVWELDVLGLFTHSTNVADLKNLLMTANPSTLSFQDMVLMGQMVGKYLRIPFTLMLIALAVIVYVGNSARKFRTTYSMQSLTQKEKTNWPQIMPVVGKNILQQDIDKGAWAMAMTPLQFCKKHNLIECYRRPPNENTSRRDPNRYETVLKRGESNKVFALQLGPRWAGVNNLPPYAKALFAAFAARINADSKSAADLLMQLNRSSNTKFNYAGVAALCKKYQDTKLVKQVTEKHAYVLTVMASLLVAARQDGVQATADFIWLKPLDRRLWYMLNAMGRQTPFAESAGPYAHWLAEREAGRKLIIPMVESATNAMEVALKGIIYNPEEEGGDK